MSKSVRIEEKVKRIISGVLQVRTDVMESEHELVEDFDADKADINEIMTSIGLEFGGEIPESVWGKLNTIKDIVEFVDGNINYVDETEQFHDSAEEIVTTINDVFGRPKPEDEVADVFKLRGVKIEEVESVKESIDKDIYEKVIKAMKALEKYA